MLSFWDSRLQKDVMMIKGGASEDVIFSLKYSPLISLNLMASKVWFRNVVCEI